MSHRGGKNKRKHKNGFVPRVRELKECEPEQEYGIVTKLLGNCRVECYCSDDTHRVCHIRGSMQKRIWIRAGDVVLVSLRDFDNSKGDIIHQYTSSEAEHLRQSKKFDPVALQNKAMSSVNINHVLEHGLTDQSVVQNDNESRIEIDFSTI